MQQKENKNFNFAKHLEAALSTLNEQELKIAQETFGTNNDRQKIKIIKKVLQSESPLKGIFNRIMPTPILLQYIFGNSQSKPTILNIFKVLDVSAKLLIEQSSILTEFQNIKLTIQVIQTLILSNRVHAGFKQQLIHSSLIEKIYLYLLKQVQIGVTSIVKNQFRTKWLDYFVEILRCANYIIKFIHTNRQRYLQKDLKLYKLVEECAQFSYLLNKQAITQLYLLLVYLNKQLPLPESPLQQIHYLHARTIIKGQNTLKPLLKLASQLKDTQHKSQLAPILLKSFLEYFQQGEKQNIKVELDQSLKQNAFDCAISLFDVGRSIYSYLEQIIDIIISHGGIWSLQGNFTRKFFITKVALKHVPTSTIINLWPNCLQDSFIQSGNMTMAYVADCADVLLTKLYHQLDKDYSKWMNIWIQPYKKSLLSGNRSHMRGITEFINPILLKINNSNSLLLKQISQMPQQNLTTQLGIISLIKCYKQVGKIQSKHNVWIQEQQKRKQKEKAQNRQNKRNKNIKNDGQIQKQQKIQQIENKQQQKKILQTQKTVFIHLDDESFQFGSQFLLDLLLSSDPMTALQTLQFLIASKKPSYLILPQQMKLILQFYKNSLKTSMPQYRKSYLNSTRRMLQRFRNNYERDISGQLDVIKNKGTKKVQQKKQAQYFSQFIKFLNELIELCFINIYPDSIFELANPALQILLLILNLFGPKGCEIRKGTYIEPCSLLIQKTQFFRIENFQNLVSCLQSSYESIRTIAHEIIRSFNNFDQTGIKSLRKIWSEAVQNTNKLSIRSYQFACRILTYISSLKINNISIIQSIPNKYKMPQLNVCEFLIIILRQRYEVFKKQFIDQGQIYYKNLIHGILTCFSYLLQQISNITHFDATNQVDFTNFLAQFFTQIIKILNFSVEISSANVSTVVLDTIANGSQTDKKMAVDCRGHFLPEKKSEGSIGSSIGSFLDSTALISSMENEDQGIENTLVVSFYLLTRQAGLVFQMIGSIMSNNLLAKFVPKKQLIQLVNTYFYALINLKHMGSVDRISNGLSKMAKVIFDQEDPQLIKIPEQLLNQILQFLNDGKFTNILRRSAGVPYAFTCLLKSQAIKRKLLIEKTIKALLKLSQQSSQTPIQLRIHSLNILKKIFQDSDLKQDLDIYVSEGIISSIKGFTSEEWGVRNSSLMLFSVLANRTIGIRPTYNLLQFFHKCPDLLNFITNQLAQKKTQQTMYPPLYPIVLLLSRLLPFDLRERVRLSVKGGTDKQMRKQELLALQPQLRRAGDNHNYMGRVMTAKAILPFMQLSNIIPHCLKILRQYIKNAKSGKINNNSEHYNLTQCYSLLKSYTQIANNVGNQNHYIQFSKQMRTNLCQVLSQGTQLLSWNNLSDSQGYISPTVQQIFIRIYHDFLDHYLKQANLNQLIQEKQNKLIIQISIKTQQLFKKLINNNDRIGDLGQSLMYKSCIELLYTCYQLLIQKNFECKGTIFIDYLNSQNSLKQNDETDYQILSLVLQKVDQVLVKSKVTSQSIELQNALKSWLKKMDISKVENDQTIIKMLRIYSNDVQIMQNSKKLQLVKIVQKIEASSQNKHMKVAIFDYLLAVVTQLQSSQEQEAKKIKNQCTSYLQSLLQSYSNPNQLQDLRECCIFYLQKITHLKPQLLVVYLRLLEDQQYEIRKRAAAQISRLLKIKPCNQLVVTRQLFARYLGGKSYVAELKNVHAQSKENQNQKQEFNKMNAAQQAKFLLVLLQYNSDYPIKVKNHQQQRIFSYDKPNKYRADISTVYQVVKQLDNDAILAFANLSKSFSNFKIQSFVEKYRQEIMQRDQYEFEALIRQMLINGGSNQRLEKFAQITNLQPMFKDVHTKCLGL